MKNKCAICGGVVSEVRNEVYKYKTAGIPVLLYGITQYKCDACKETFASIPEVEKLHLLLGEKLCCKADRLSGDEIRFLRKELKLKSVDFAKILGISPAYLSRLEGDTKKTSEALDKFIRAIYILEQSEFHKQVMHRDILSTLRDVSVEPVSTKKKAFEFNPTDWLKPPQYFFCPA
jgi:putative zinc finger/helix-turn-helix YgiT family protein